MQQFTFNKYFAKKSFLKLFGGEIRIYNENKNNLLFFVKQKAFKLKEDITVYADETKTKELLKIKARSVIDFSAIYDVVDVSSNERIGSLRRKGFKSILKDSWEILDPRDQVIGSIDEDSMLKAMLRRFLTNLIPQTFFITVNKNQVGVLKQTFNPFVPQFNIDFSADTAKILDRRMGIAIVILLQIIEGRQE
ncbi:hypothetical protein ND861_03280 [Leptospira sp. 2 VSF19]|uniref:Uncharacterized protein n=1 Tax=Leptospira soteropolitanensis TaxID=2950025 RepID=A0AAW5VI55_9LEPT|nr:hypothetical protein [Leptospira soteropolitanensis]MCW7491668.1 hypothetical protein [Leptospira soteropolitanensis]MCW7499252.1 hypothetical protein [Leptospira soteropolitanensis]MCW7521156.1 hypothetical protein [Leptospira soteropolitanensis]MCW7525356.1 hypothetical protein [Leptospira soteropolitanensis]MCW7529223.1 hypothetical protein [Leptospira soteropolitanensis]